MCGCKGGEEMVLRRAYRTLGGICAVVEWGDVLEGNVVLDE